VSGAGDKVCADIEGLYIECIVNYSVRCPLKQEVGIRCLALSFGDYVFKLPNTR